MPRSVAAMIASTSRSSPRGAPQRVDRPHLGLQRRDRDRERDPADLRRRRFAVAADEVVGSRLDPRVGRVADAVRLGEELDLGDRPR